MPLYPKYAKDLDFGAYSVTFVYAAYRRTPLAICDNIFDNC